MKIKKVIVVNDVEYANIGLAAEQLEVTASELQGILQTTNRLAYYKTIVVDDVEDDIRKERDLDELDDNFFEHDE